MRAYPAHVLAPLHLERREGLGSVLRRILGKLKMVIERLRGSIPGTRPPDRRGWACVASASTNSQAGVGIYQQVLQYAVGKQLGRLCTCDN